MQQSAIDAGAGRTIAGLLIAVLAVSWSAIFVRWAGETPALVIAFYRMLWAFLLFLVISRVSGNRDGHRHLQRSDYRHILSAGLWLALHFATWISSLKYTTVAHSLTLYATQPIFALILGPLIIGERGDRRAILAVLLALIGVAVVSGIDTRVDSQQFLGDMLALVSALFMTLYIFVARRMRKRVALAPYLMMVYGTAAAILLLINLAAGLEIFRYSGEVHLVMLLLALIPTGVGHSMFNWAARRIEAYKVNIAAMGEPIPATLMAFLFFGEAPQAWFYAGALLIAAGIAIAMKRARRERS